MYAPFTKDEVEDKAKGIQRLEGGADPIRPLVDLADTFGESAPTDREGGAMPTSSRTQNRGRTAAVGSGMDFQEHWDQEKAWEQKVVDFAKAHGSGQIPRRDLPLANR